MASPRCWWIPFAAYLSYFYQMIWGWVSVSRTIVTWCILMWQQLWSVSFFRPAMPRKANPDLSLHPKESSLYAKALISKPVPSPRTSIDEWVLFSLLITVVWWARRLRWRRAGVGSLLGNIPATPCKENPLAGFPSGLPPQFLSVVLVPACTQQSRLCCF